MRTIRFFDPTIPLLGMGLVSLVLGTVGLLLFFLPILSLPIAAFGLAFGMIGLCAALLGKGNLRWCVGGIALSCLAIGIDLAIMLAASAFYLPQPGEQKLWQSNPEKHFVSPPARQGMVPDRTSTLRP